MVNKKASTTQLLKHNYVKGIYYLDFYKKIDKMLVL